MSERDVALRILGLTDDADPAEIDAARRELRAHVEARLARAASDDERAARRAELRDLDAALRALADPDEAPRRARPAARATGRRSLLSRALFPRWILGLAILAAVAAALLFALFFTGSFGFGPSVLVGGRGAGDGGGGGGDGFALEGGAGIAEGGEGDEAGPGGGAQSAGPRAEVVVRSDVEGARLRILERGGAEAPADAAPQVVAEGAPDDTVYYLAPGRYAIEVEHADCADGWRRDVAVEGGEKLRLDPEVCRSTGWLAVQSDPPTDRVSIDGREVARSSADARHAVPAGEHEIRVEKAGFEPWEGVVAVAAGQVTGIRPRLASLRKAEPEPKERPAEPASDGADASGPNPPSTLHEIGGWHVQAKRWLLAVYDEDRSGSLDSESELAAIPCDQWLGLEKSYDASGLALPMTRFYGFDGDNWKGELLGVDSRYRDVAYERMRACGLR